MQIKEVNSKAIKDSRGILTIQVSINNCKASSPSGTSAGRFESKSYRKNLNQSIKDIYSIENDLKKIKISSFEDLIKLEKLIKNKFKLNDVKAFGANALFALESAILKALAKENKKQLWQIVNPNLNKKAKFPIPIGNAIGGGEHSREYKDHPVFQEFEIIPNKKTIKENVKVLREIYNKLGKELKTTQKNYEGAWQKPISNEQAIDLLYKAKRNAQIGLDIAASTFYKNNLYDYKNKILDRKSQISYIISLIKDCKLFYIEDPLDESDFSGFAEILKSISSTLINSLVVGDDLTATHIKRIKKAIKTKSINALIIKPNQNGSLLELKQIFELCKKNKIKTILSHRSGETLDSALADYAFAFQADFIKTGISTKYRECKLNRLIEIENSINKLKQEVFN